MILYYTHNLCDKKIFEECQKQLLKSEVPIVSVSLKPINFGKNIVMNLEAGAITQIKQILAGLNEIKSDYVFFCEHDVLYHPSHFDFKPPLKDTFYFNTNNWRWDYPNDRLVGYDGMRSLSGMCCYRELALDYYTRKIELIKKKGWKNGRDPEWARKIGYEPGKTIRRGGFMISKTDNWKSEYPNIDIRHNTTMTKRKVNLSEFKHQPKGWKEITFNNLEWNFQF